MSGGLRARAGGFVSADVPARVIEALDGVLSPVMVTLPNG